MVDCCVCVHQREQLAFENDRLQCSANQAERKGIGIWSRRVSLTSTLYALLSVGLHRFLEMEASAEASQLGGCGIGT